MTRLASGQKGRPDVTTVDRGEFERFVRTITSRLNDHVFRHLNQCLLLNPGLRETLNPAFPYPKALRIGLLDTHLVVEYVGPEDGNSEQFSINATWREKQTVFEFLGIDVRHLSCPCLPCPAGIENVQVFLGDAINILGDYLYDVVLNPNDLILNGLPDFTVAKEPTFVSNVTFLWSDPGGALRFRRIDFMELFPIMDGGWAYHAKEKDFHHFASFLAAHAVPRYQMKLHAALNEFIRLVSGDGVDEPTITSFLTLHPELLQLALGANQLNSQTELVWQYDSGKPNLKPDFMPETMDGFVDIVEFKLPRLKSKPMVGTATRAHPSFEVDSAIAQIDEYNDWCNQEVNRRWLEKERGLKILAPKTILVMGHSDDFSAEDRQRLRERRNAMIFTYDEFIEMTRMQLYRVH